MPPLPPPHLDGSAFESLGQGLAGYSNSNSYEVRRRRFVSFFGIEPCLVSVVWSMVVMSGALDGLHSVNPIHFLWALLFFQCYDTSERNAAMCRCDEKTFRKWSWFYLELIAGLDELLVSLGQARCWCATVSFDSNTDFLHLNASARRLSGITGWWVATLAPIVMWIARTFLVISYSV